MSKKVVISVCEIILEELAARFLEEKMYDKYHSGDNLGSDEILNLLENEPINSIPIEFLNNIKVLEIPDEYNVIVSNDYENSRQNRIIIGKDVRLVNTLGVKPNTDLYEYELKKIKDFIVPFKIEDK